MIKKELIQEIVLNSISGTDIFIVHISVGKDNKIFVRIDNLVGITLDECLHISKFIETSLDRDKEDFELEVSSPGLGEPFRVKQQFLKSISRTLIVIDKEGKKRIGVLKNVDEDEITIEAEEKIKDEKTKKKKTVINEYKFNINNITAKEVLSF
ncbi:MAG: hypothetical protein A2275_00400 [Bacteroidetes bacterium RIFOXYA12_FULL_35_11]|nr:MAG: hypothetical protein A2X01_04910 [Bacteroidetes bacterium GWF2_35_48]OFY79299.1 MAG: hypothetical protein A2275_00400 [Bacteroidetes bacterium RIFOXYA12_FULL_35_11]OFY99477.1 MAG: hypothetical protein A2491_08040 [Bacteroidetes bacterium RIFOXYC12_FULL_35_7]